MKYLILIAIIYFLYRFYNKPKKNEDRLDDFPPQREKEEDYGEYTDYEEIE